MRFLTHAYGPSSVHSIPIAIICSALFPTLPLPLLRRWWLVLPDDAGIGLTPHSAAKLDSDLNHSGLSPNVVTNCPADSYPT